MNFLLETAEFFLLYALKPAALSLVVSENTLADKSSEQPTVISIVESFRWEELFAELSRVPFRSHPAHSGLLFLIYSIELFGLHSHGGSFMAHEEVRRKVCNVLDR